MKKILFSILILFIVVTSSFYFLKRENTEENSSVDLKSKIEEFSALDEEKRIKIKKFIHEKSFNDSEKVILFLQENNNLGYAILKNGNIKTVAYGDNNQSYEQYKNYFFVYGEKPNKNNKELKITIDAGDNFEEMEKTIALDENDYFLSIGELPEEIENSRVFSENFKYY